MIINLLYIFMIVLSSQPQILTFELLCHHDCTKFEILTIFYSRTDCRMHVITTAKRLLCVRILREAT